MIATLILRLDQGWDLCERESDPERRRGLETFWIQLLLEYERTCNAERQAGEEQAA